MGNFWVHNDAAFLAAQRLYTICLGVGNFYVNTFSAVGIPPEQTIAVIKAAMRHNSMRWGEEDVKLNLSMQMRSSQYYYDMHLNKPMLRSSQAIDKFIQDHFAKFFYNEFKKTFGKNGRVHLVNLATKGLLLDNKLFQSRLYETILLAQYFQVKRQGDPFYRRISDDIKACRCKKGISQLKERELLSVYSSANELRLILNSIQQTMHIAQLQGIRIPYDQHLVCLQFARSQLGKIVQYTQKWRFAEPLPLYGDSDSEWCERVYNEAEQLNQNFNEHMANFRVVDALPILIVDNSHFRYLSLEETRKIYPSKDAITLLSTMNQLIKRKVDMDKTSEHPFGMAPYPFHLSINTGLNLFTDEEDFYIQTNKSCCCCGFGGMDTKPFGCKIKLKSNLMQGIFKKNNKRGYFYERHNCFVILSQRKEATPTRTASVPHKKHEEIGKVGQRCSPCL